MQSINSLRLSQLHMIFLQEQQSAVDSIESNIEHAQVNVHDATQELGKVGNVVIYNGVW